MDMIISVVQYSVVKKKDMVMHVLGSGSCKDSRSI